MADFETGDIIRVGASMLLELVDDVVNVYHLRLNTGGPMDWADMLEDIQDFMDGVMTTLDTELTVNLTANVLSVANITQNMVFGSIAWGTFAAGGAAGSVAPSGCACLVFARTRTPRVQMRKYYGPFPNGALSSGSWDAGVTGACGDSMDYLIAEHTMTNGAQLQGVAYNRTLDTYAYGITVTTRSEPAYQRRRKRGVGS